MVYLVIQGEYSDWNIIGYFKDKLEAEKYCAANAKYNYYLKPATEIEADEDFLQIELKYTHKISFELKNNEWVMLDKSDYDFYAKEELKPNCANLYFYGNIQQIVFKINLAENNPKKAEKIACDYLYQLIGVSSQNGFIDPEAVENLNEYFMTPYRLAEKKKIEEELRQKELAELARLKAKYEGECV